MKNRGVAFWIPEYEKLGLEICELASLEPGQIERRSFPDGEHYVRILSEVRGRDVVMVGGTIDDAATLQIYDLASGLVSEGCRSLKLVLPFFGYSTMERAVKKGEIVTAKIRARLLSAIPSAPFGNQVLLFDLHSEGIPFYFEGALSPVHLYAKPLILKEIRRIAKEDLVMGCTDAGRAKWVESLANDLGVPAAFVFKKRISGDKVRITGLNIDVKNKHVVIYDDMIRTGGSLLQAVEAYSKGGAKRISVLATHGVFCEDAIAKLQKTKLVDQLICTDSHPRALASHGSFLKVLPSAPLFASFLKDAL